MHAVAKKLGDGIDPSSILLKFVDDEGDTVIISSNECLADAISLARQAGNAVLKLSVSVSTEGMALSKIDLSNDMVLLGGAVAGAIAFLAILMMALRPKRS